MNARGLILTISLMLGLGVAIYTGLFVQFFKTGAQAQEEGPPPFFQVVQTDSVWDKDGIKYRITTLKHQTSPDYCLAFIWTTDLYKSAGGPIETPCP